MTQTNDILLIKGLFKRIYKTLKSVSYKVIYGWDLRIISDKKFWI